MPPTDAPGQLVVYLQYTNPAGYPPLQHSSRILANLGFRILFLGAAAHGAESLVFPPHPRIEVRRMRGFLGAKLQPLYFLGFIFWSTALCVWRRPDWIYVSEHLASPAALLIRYLTNARVAYHEHDTPAAEPSMSIMQRMVRAARCRLAIVADLCVLPQARRLEIFVAETKRRGPVECVWNCPSLDEALVPPQRPALGKRPISFYFHGSLNAERLPYTVIDAMARVGKDATLTIVGYETVGSNGFMDEFIARAKASGIRDRIHYAGPLSRAEMMSLARQSDVGFSFMPKVKKDLNMIHMTGASNKPFDYMAVGQFLLVSDLPDWKAMFVDPGHGLACDPYNAADLACAMQWCIENAGEARKRGEFSRQRILNDWNYEQFFAPVALRMTGKV